MKISIINIRLSQAKQYLKIEANAIAGTRLKDKRFTKLPDNKIIVPLDDNLGLDQLILKLTKEKIPYSVGRIDLAELFSKFYG